MHESLDEFKFRQDTDTNTRVICPCASEKLLYNVVSTQAWMSSNFGKFATELRPLIDVRIKFLLNILKTNRPFKTKFFIHVIIDKIYIVICKSLFFANLKQSYGP